MNNYEFCAQWVLERAKELDRIRVLDYGCGAGEIVKLLRQNKIDALGCDVFYDGCEYPELMASELFGIVIVKMDDRKIPFSDNYFDIVVNNQVMEHVEDLDDVLSEIDRVLKPGGKVLSIFPDLGVWREVHCNIPFLHRFAKGSKLRVYYTLLFRLMGVGTFKGEKTPLQWSQDICIWVDRWTHYRSSEEINRHYLRHFQDIQSIEARWLTQRLQDRLRFIQWIPSVIKSYIAKKLAGRVIVASNRVS